MCIFIAHFQHSFLFPLYEAAFIADQSLFVINDHNPVRPLQGSAPLSQWCFSTLFPTQRTIMLFASPSIFELFILFCNFCF